MFALIQTLLNIFLENNGDYRTVISGSHIQTLVNGSLVIRDVEQEDDGRYMCEASNGVGSPLSTVVKLTVHGKF